MKSLIPVTLLTVSLFLTNAAQAEEEATAADIWQETKIVTSYVLNTQLNPFDIEVAVRDGKAYLAGTLPSAEDKALAERIARSVEGIEQVDNEILLDKNVPHNEARYDADKAGTDANITAMVKAQLLWNELTHAHDISVSTDDGVVTLSGPVASEEEAREIVRIATSTRWVQKVDNQLHLSKSDS